MKIALIAIGRLENQYAREWVEHHLNVGFDHIIIADNNHDGEERFESVLGDYVVQNKVTIHDYRNREAVQATAYNELYRRYAQDYDWLAFFDFDEFLILQSGTLKRWLAAQRKATEVVKVNWMCMTDNNLFINDHRPLMERFTEPMPLDRCVQKSFPENNHVKSIVRGKLTEVCFKNPHVPATPACQDPSPFRHYDYSKAYLRHFVTKTIEEWLTNKCRRGVGDRTMENFEKKYKDRFFRYNEPTKEKQQYAEAFRLCPVPASSVTGLTVAIVHYNTPKLTCAAVLSLWKHTPGCRVVVFDNSDRLPIADNQEWKELRENPLVTIIDNTHGQQIDFDKMLEAYPNRQMSDRNESNFGSAKHTASVDRLFDLLPDGFILMDSDVLVHQDIRPLYDRTIAAAGRLKPNQGVMRLLPLLCWINVPMLRQHGIRYFNGQKMWALSDRYPDNRYDTGAWLLEEINRYHLPLREVVTKDYILHLGHASWRSKSPMAWLREHQDLWL